MYFLSVFSALQVVFMPLILYTANYLFFIKGIKYLLVLFQNPPLCAFRFITWSPVPSHFGCCLQLINLNRIPWVPHLILENGSLLSCFDLPGPGRVFFGISSVTICSEGKSRVSVHPRKRKERPPQMLSLWRLMLAQPVCFPLRKRLWSQPKKGGHDNRITGDDHHLCRRQLYRHIYGKNIEGALLKMAAIELFRIV